MKTSLLLLAMLALVGCSSFSGGKAGGQSGASASAGVTQAAPRYEHQLDVEYSDGATPFLRLVPADEP